jgi:hypothetical protein
MSGASLREVAQQLGRLQAMVEDLQRREASRAAAEKLPGGKSAVPEGVHSNGGSGDGEVGTDDEAGGPQLYPASPRVGVDALEEGGFFDRPVLDSLRLDEGAGFYNLASLMFGASLVYMTTRNIREHGVQARLVDFT